MEDAKKCRKCGGTPHLIQKDGLWYARCSSCAKWPAYEFLGISKLAAIRNWNEGNTPNASNTPRKIDNEDF